MKLHSLPIFVVALASGYGEPGHAPATQPEATIQVIALDYALAAPDSAAAGLTVFTLENRGDRDHELAVGLLKPGAGPADIAAAHQKGLTLRQLQTAYLDGMVGGALLAAPHTTSPASLLVPLVAGRDYVLLCQLRDSAGAPQHAALGMFHILHVH